MQSLAFSQQEVCTCDQASLGCTGCERSLHSGLSTFKASSFLHNIAALEGSSGIIYVGGDDFTTESGKRCTTFRSTVSTAAWVHILCSFVTSPAAVPALKKQFRL